MYWLLTNRFRVVPKKLVSEKRFKESLKGVLKCINLNPITLFYILNQKLLFMYKTNLCKTGLH